ncbi:MarR family transcriptional regulator [Nocardia cyriacigeorgica]|uniref:MarR family transcriptional regulator n=1 Tax=Nocardia cyriacigeorgica TaxID=135487 RepID=A0A6P1D917_9NOCA|nr:helix-turn-helix domain-containing protein [Nocardia cyriacigeorgica]NEW39873.1 MarR family transcriptional regulator [Nocardia cyriacigeorgica]NEW47196.1 MarR family transcriptional regulator [Nocardia cyriacigeorgica]NEW51358.1 MarR family transcriptional regulator [Nocardia cyriacigeorgica]NEW55423.1 MarR family transcriptional regulator [Nocardia cyriacigeorgica]
MGNGSPAVDAATLDRTSPPTARVVRLLNFLVAHQGERFGLAELSRRCEVSKPTGLGILTELVAAGYVTRDPRGKTYGLGPALIAAGRAAQRDMVASPTVRLELEGLSERFDAICTASGVVGDKIVVLEIVAPPGTTAPAKVGQTYPYAPPVGLMYLLWEPDSELDRWMEREPVLPVELDRDQLLEAAADCRASGYLVEGTSREMMRLHTLMAGAVGHDLPADVRYLLGEMVANLGRRMYFGRTLNDSAGPHRVSLIGAPVYDVDGRQSMVLNIYIDRVIENAELTELTSALKAAGDRLTAEAGGYDPFVSLRGT